MVTGESVGADCVVFEQGARHSFQVDYLSAVTKCNALQDAIGRDIANPTAMLLCSANMLGHLHLHDYKSALTKAVEKTLRDGRVKTRDLGGFATTVEFSHEVIKNYNLVPDVLNK